MSSTIRSTRRARFSRRAALAAVATAALGAGAFAAAGPAFADDGPGSTLTGTVVVGSTLTIHPSTQAFAITAVPGVPVSVPVTLVLRSSDSAGYDLSAALITQFGGIPDTDWAAGQNNYPGQQNPWVTTQVPYNAAGASIPLFGTNGVSGAVGNPGNPYLGSAPGQPVFSDPTAGTDTIITDVQLSLPTGYPGSPVNGWTGAFQYALIGR